MIAPRHFRSFRRGLLISSAALMTAFPALAAEKAGMPDLAQIDQTCLPTSTANLMIWFGKHGYPKLILSGEDKDAQYLHTVHRIMTATDARFDLGTPMDMITSGIEKYTKDCGYECTVEYRGLEGKGTKFDRDWLKENDDPNKGFLLVLAYIHYDPQTNSYRAAIGATHAVTLVNAEPDLLLVHDPAHEETETGRKIITAKMLTDGAFLEPGGSQPVAGLMLLSGSLLDGPPDSQVMLFGAICITMHPLDAPKPPSSKAPNGVVAGDTGSVPAPAPTTSSPAKTAPSGWGTWLFNLIFGK
jgi:hypothetical protein